MPIDQVVDKSVCVCCIKADKALKSAKKDDRAAKLEAKKAVVRQPHVEAYPISDIKGTHENGEGGLRSKAGRS
jgi:hypothetical protein